MAKRSKNKKKVISPRAIRKNPVRKRRKRVQRGMFSPSELENMREAFVIGALGQAIASAISRMMPGPFKMYSSPEFGAVANDDALDDVLDAEIVGGD